MRNPAIDYLTEKYQELQKREKMERELQKYATKIPGGYVMTIGQLQQFFKSLQKK